MLLGPVQEVRGNDFHLVFPAEHGCQLQKPAVALSVQPAAKIGDDDNIHIGASLFS